MQRASSTTEHSSDFSMATMILRATYYCLVFTTMQHRLLVCPSFLWVGLSTIQPEANVRMASGGMNLYAGDRGIDYGLDSGSLDEHSEYTMTSFDKQGGRVALLPSTGHVHSRSHRSPKDVSASLAVELCQPWVTAKLTKCLTIKGADAKREKAHHEFFFPLGPTFSHAIKSGKGCPLPEPFMYMVRNNSICCFGDDPDVWPNVCPRLTEEQRRKAAEKYKGFRVAVHQFTTVKLVPVGDVKGHAPTELPITFESPRAVSGDTVVPPQHSTLERTNARPDGEGLARANTLEARALPKTRDRLHTVYRVGPPVGYRGGVRTVVPRWTVGLAVTLLVLSLTVMLNMRRLQLERDLAEKSSAYEQAHFIDGEAASTRRSFSEYSSRGTDSASSSYSSSSSSSAGSMKAYNTFTRQSSAGLVPQLSGGPFAPEVRPQVSAIDGLVPDAVDAEEDQLPDEDPLDTILS